MKLYQNHMASSCRPLRLFLADNPIDIELVDVDLMAGAHQTPAFSKLNPNQAVPVLEDGGWVLTEGSAILQFLAEMIGSSAYPADPRARAQIRSAMDWFTTGFVKDFGLGMVYPAVFPQFRLSESAQAEVTEKASARIRRSLDILDRDLLGERPFVAGFDVSLADYVGVAAVTLGDWIGFDLSPWQRIQIWCDRMRSRPAAASEWQLYDHASRRMRPCV